MFEVELFTDCWSNIMVRLLKDFPSEYNEPDNYSMSKTKDELFTIAYDIVLEIDSKCRAGDLLYDCIKEMGLDLRFHDIVVLNEIGLGLLMDVAKRSMLSITPSRLAG
jgi:hypothetical protein